MSINPSYKLIVIVLLSSFYNCSTIQLNKHNGFWEWFIGKPGTLNAGGIREEPTDGVILGDRHPFYLWLRTPEIILNPQGGVYYPDMIIIGESGKIYNTSQMKENGTKMLPERNLAFHVKETGLIDFLLMYREIFDPSGDMRFVGAYCVLFPFFLFLFTGKNLVPKIIVYPIHDVIKTVMIPVAAVYYTVKAFDDNDEEESAE
ncbi:MAG: hypothetical protein KDK90_27625 [Leptospiraceae bacterium]|nr:hypothetical protein [Leptospiraceae bacterium]